MAVDQSAFQFQGRTSSAPSTYFVKQHGQLSEVTIGREQMQAVTPGYKQLRFRGLSAPFELDGQYGKSKNVRVVFQVRGGGAEDKRMFSQLLTIAKPAEGGGWRSNITSKTAIGQMIGAIRGKPIGDGEPINLLDYLNGDFCAVVQQKTRATDNGIEVDCSVVKDTWQPVGQEALPEVLQPAPHAVAAPGVAATANPFLGDDD